MFVTTVADRFFWTWSGTKNSPNKSAVRKFCEPLLLWSNWQFLGKVWNIQQVQVFGVRKNGWLLCAYYSGVLYVGILYVEYRTAKLHNVSALERVTSDIPVTRMREALKPVPPGTCTHCDYLRVISHVAFSWSYKWMTLPYVFGGRLVCARMVILYSALATNCCCVCFQGVDPSITVQFEAVKIMSSYPLSTSSATAHVTC